MMFTKRIVALSVAAVLSSGAHALDVVPLGITQAESDSYAGWGVGLFPYHLLFEQVRFHGPTGAVGSSIYYWGRPIYNSTTSSDLCAGANVCGEQLGVSTRLLGEMSITAKDSNQAPLVVVQNLGTNFTGLGVASTDANGAVVGDMAINQGETVTITFSKVVRLMGLTLWDQFGSNNGDSENDALMPLDSYGISVDGGPVLARHMSNNYPWFGPQYGQSAVLWGRSFTFSYVDRDYYIGAVKVAEVPEPGTFGLMLAGLGAAALVGRRRRQR